MAKPWEMKWTVEPVAADSATQEPAAQRPWEMKWTVEAPVAEPSALDNALASPAGRTAVDVAKTIPGAAARGVNALLGMPADVASFLGDISATGLEKLVGYFSPEEGAKVRAAREALRKVNEGSDRTAVGQMGRLAGSDELNKATQGVLGDYYEPQTTAGKYAGTATEFAVGAAGPALAAKGGRALARAVGMDVAPAAQTLGEVAKTGLKYGVVPGVASETAGQAFEGTENEPYARAIAPLLVGGGLAFNDIRTSNRPLIEAFSQVKQEHRDAGLRFMEEAREAGTPITAAEAINQVSGGAYPRLLDFQRLAEDSKKGGDLFAGMMAERPEAAKRLYGRVAEEVGPVPDAPFEVAPRVKQAAARDLTEVRQGINAQAEPLYGAALTREIPEDIAQALGESPVFKSYAAKLQADPVMQEALQGVQPGTVGYLDAVKKAVDADLNALTAPNVGRDNARISALTQFKDRLTGIADEVAPEYAEARRIGAEGRQNVLAPLERAPTGQLADVSDIPDAWKQQARVLFGAEAPGAAPQAAEAMATVMKADPEAGRSLARMYLEKRFEKATQNLMSGENQWGASKFAKEVIGDKGKREAFNAVMREVNPQAEPALDFMLKVFEAQGRRQAKGSRTAPTTQLTEEMKDSAPGLLVGAAQTASRVKLNPLSWIGLSERPLQNISMNYNMKTIAQALTDPETTAKIMKITKFTPQAPGTALRLTAILNQSMMQAEKAQPRALPPGTE